MKDEMAISHTEHEPKIIKAPGCNKKKFFRMSKFIYKGVFLVNINGAHGTLYAECQGKKIVEDFKTCIMHKSDSFIKAINLKSYKQETHLSKFVKFQMIFPEDGSVGLKQTYKPTIMLNPLFEYIFCLFDKDFLLFISNPLIVPRSCLTISQNSSFIQIPLKVGISMKQDLK